MEIPFWYSSYSVIFLAHLKKGCALPPITLTFSDIGKVMPKFDSQNFLISALFPGSCLKLFVGTPITTRSFLNLVNKSCKSLY